MSGVSKGMLIMKELMAQCSKQDKFHKFAGAIKPVFVKDNHAQFELEVTENLTNMHDTLHGGCSATLIDLVTTALCVADPRGKPGVSVNLNVNYMSAAKKGETVVIDAFMKKMGRTLAFTEAEIRIKGSDKMVASGLHTKAFP